MISLRFLVLAALGSVACYSEPVHASVRPSASQHDSSSVVYGLSKNQRELFTSTMSDFDEGFNTTSELLFNSVRYTAWYAVGLLARNEDGDVPKASALLENAIAAQYKDPTKIWFGTFKGTPDDPDPSTLPNPQIYTDYDPNVRGFVGTSFIIALEEFKHLLKPGLVSLIEESLYNATIGDGYRVGGWDNDNLYPVYSNPWLMRCICSSWVGHNLGDDNLTYWGDIFAREAVDLFDQYDTLSEFNSATYEGVSLYALTLWNRYGPPNSVVKKHGARMIKGIWKTIGQLYNPSILNLGGPWDRTYGYDMTQYFSILGAQIAGLVGIDEAPMPSPLVNSNHYSDAAIIPLLAIISASHDTLVAPSVVQYLKKLEGNHTWTGNAYSPPFDYATSGSQRNYTVWQEEGLSIGAMEINEARVGGPAINNQTFNPAVVQWDTGIGSVGYLALFPTENHISGVVDKRSLTITYPAPNKTASVTTMFTLIIGP
ncbi:hypothetical protein PUNSTDRAFT_81236, partial [Punctularia strigosozonata HHB-11173 SS5]|uniref:uncharacterized protein n=1 Tax=Punctularia strigosozonata (strain HHB-11173) TaxID=741275 RepID=UPI00044182AE